MSRKKTDKRMTYLEPNFKDVLVCKSKDLRPYLEIFVEAPQNVAQHNLGTLAGILEITDNSEDSSYIVNYLISIIKKEYFSKTRRGSMESFEAALHKANLALAKLAEHETVGWISHFNAVIMILEKNNMHITQTGTAAAFLLRSKTLTNICENEAGEGTIEANPIRTFEDVLSGRLEKGDKIILTTYAIFDIFSFEEIKRSALKFPAEDFIQFLKTALVNELDRAAVLVVDIKEKEEEIIAAPKRSAEVNAFSQVTFIPKAKPGAYMGSEERLLIVEELKKELVKEQEGFIDKKTGHIYIKDDGGQEKDFGFDNYMKRIKTFAEDFGRASGRYLKKAVRFSGVKIYAIGKKSASKISSIKMNYAGKKLIKEEKETPLASVVSEKETVNTQINDRLSEVPEKPKPEFPKERILPIFKKTASVLTAITFYGKSFSVNRVIIPIKNFFIFLARSINQLIQSLIASHKTRKASKKEKKNGPDQSAIQELNYAEKSQVLSATRVEKKEWFRALSAKEDMTFRDAIPSLQTREAPFQRDPPQEIPPQDSPKIRKKILPDFSKIKTIFRSLNYRKRIYLIIVIIAILVVPYFINKIEDNLKEKPAVVQNSPAPAPPPLARDINVSQIKGLDNVYSGTDILGPVNVNGKIFAVKKDAIISLGDSKNYPIPQDFIDPELSFGMDDLNLIFLLKDSRITSFSAVSGQFQTNNINIPAGSDIVDAKSYLTYAYLMDTKNNQIYRFPRATGGFGDKTDWLKAGPDLSGAKSIAINENVYITDGKEIMKFFRGKKQDFTLGQTATPIAISEIYTTPDSQNLYVLDKSNSRIIKLDQSGNIQAQYYNPEIGSATDFTVDEGNNTFYVSTGSDIKSFAVN